MAKDDKTDPELAALAATYEALTGFDRPARHRIMTWVHARLDADQAPAIDDEDPF